MQDIKKAGQFVRLFYLKLKKISAAGVWIKSRLQ